MISIIIPILQSRILVQWNWEICLRLYSLEIVDVVLELRTLWFPRPYSTILYWLSRKTQSYQTKTMLIFSKRSNWLKWDLKYIHSSCSNYQTYPDKTGFKHCRKSHSNGRVESMISGASWFVPFFLLESFYQPRHSLSIQSGFPKPSMSVLSRQHQIIFISVCSNKTYTSETLPFRCLSDKSSIT